MAKTPEYMYVRPVEIDVGRGPELARVTIRRDKRVWELPAKGDKVPARRREGGFWLRRIIEGTVERFDPKTGHALTIDGKSKSKPITSPAPKNSKD